MEKQPKSIKVSQTENSSLTLKIDKVRVLKLS
jgi:hypothetical protein